MKLLDTINLLANRKLHDRIKFRGLSISIENRKGSIRRGIDKNGKVWKTKMTWPYGYIRLTKGVDEDHVDCFVGPNENAKNVYVIHRQDSETKKYDEDKCMIGFNSEEDARQAFNENYDKPGNLGGLTTMTFEKFKDKVLRTKDNPKKLIAGTKW